MVSPQEILLSVIVVAALLYGVSVVFRSLGDRFKAATEWRHSLDERLDRLEKDLKRVKEVAEDSELSEAERRQRLKRRAFDNARELPLPFLRNLPTGTILPMISRSLGAPADSADIEEFEYKHERVDESESSQFGRGVHGSSRRSGSDAWSSYAFFANDVQARTSTGSHHLRRRLK
ncbi:MAG TPA: hypothetical protein VGS00_04910 [Thermoanaerobaculia bacterium]|nr:hypothetical protein [Thermoanaerobaculia bacterium]